MHYYQDTSRLNVQRLRNGLPGKYNNFELIVYFPSLRVIFAICDIILPKLKYTLKVFRVMNHLTVSHEKHGT